MNKVFVFNFIFLIILTVYLLVANLGLLGVSFVYDQDSYSPWRSHFWPRGNYEVIDNKKIILKQSTWLDVKLPLMFQRARLEIEGENIDYLELAWKVSVEGEVLLISQMPTSGILEIDFSNLEKPNYLVFLLSEEQSFNLDKLKISFFYPRWFYDFKKNMLE